jgi:hypothetical protein
MDQALVARPAHCVNLLSEPLDQVVIKTDRDPYLARWCLHDRTTFGLADIVVPLYGSLSYRRRFRPIARREEMIRILSCHHVGTTTGRRPEASCPAVENRPSSARGALLLRLVSMTSEA